MNRAVGEPISDAIDPPEKAWPVWEVQFSGESKMTPDPTLLPVEQCDRDAAKTYLLMIPGFHEAEAQRFANGEFDELPDALPQHFARHRQKAIAECPKCKG